jgi:hypothetical protein
LYSGNDKNYYTNNGFDNVNIPLTERASRNIEKFSPEKEKRSTKRVSERNSRSAYNLSKSQYQYNLFSAIDELVNNNCSNCGNNEIVAKSARQAWD